MRMKTFIKGKTSGKRAFIAAAVLAGSLACGQKNDGPADAGMPRRPGVVRDSGVQQDSGASDSGMNLFGCQSVARQELTCEGPISDELSPGEMVSAGEVYVRVDDVSQDAYGLTAVGISILNPQCAQIHDSMLFSGQTSEISFPDGTRMAVAVRYVTGQNAEVQVYNRQCERECMKSQEATQQLAEGGSMPIDSSMGLLSLTLEAVDQNGIMSLSLRNGEGVLWSLYLTQGNTVTADFWDVRFLLSPQRMNLNARTAEIKIEEQECSVP